MSTVKVWVAHPESGHVTFDSLSPAQTEALTDLIAKAALVNSVVAQNHLMKEKLDKSEEDYASLSAELRAKIG